MVGGPMWHRGDVPDDDTLTDESRRTGTRDRSPLTWLVAIVVVLLIAGATVFALLNRGSDGPEAGSGGTSGAESTSTTELVAEPSTERCMTPNVEVLRLQTVAFDGVVRSVTGGEATLEPSHFYVGEETAKVVVQAPDGDLQALLAAVDFHEGERYLVAASDGRVTLCGFSGAYTEELARLYEDAFGG
jgi:hypothetical protein